ncbi:hypothetical protein [Lentibacillus salinarum]|uniref:Uncharacterized protein n=1 Tax=Lentibacillus salinarum TaxID=446820 RepID=A0ABW3ZYI7_9BACI
MEKILYYVEPQDNFEAEGRRFYKGEKYPVSKNRYTGIGLIFQNTSAKLLNIVDKSIRNQFVQK